MSKSDPERRATVYIDDSIDEADRKFRSAVSESEPLPSDVDGLNGRPAAIALVDLLASLEERTRVDILAEIGGRGFSVLKSRLSEAFERRITPIGKDIHSLLGQDRDRLETMLDEGALRAEASAERMMVQVRAKVGFRPCIPPCRA